MSTNSLRTLRFEASQPPGRSASPNSRTLFGRFPRVLAISIATAAAFVTIGCGSHSQFQSPATSAAVTGMRGKVRGGQQPITGSTIQLYAAGTTGDGSAATPLLTTPVATDSSGDFTITNDYTCPTPSTNVYLAATGGNPGLGLGTNNPNISMIAALGPCSNLNSSTYVFVNEATTIASVFPFTQFMTSYSALGSTTLAADVTAIDNDFATVNEFVDTTNGTLPGPSLPAGDGADTTKLYTLSNIVSTCINSPGGIAGDGSPCGNFFLYATPPSGSGVAAPTDIVGALLDIANYPTNNLAQLFALAPSTGPFQPTLPVAPADWTIRIEPSITLSLPSTLIGNGNTLTGTVTLGQAAPGGGLTVNVSSSQAGFVTVNSVAATTVSIAAGATSGTFLYQGVAGGTSVIEASATGYISDTASVTSTASLISLGTIPTLAPGQMVSLPLSLGTAAPAGGVTINFATAAGAPAPTSLATVVPASVFISAGLTVPTANPQVTGGTIGSTQITATATGYAPDVVTVNVSVTAAFNPNTLSMPVSPPPGSLNLTISAPAPTGGISFTLGSNNTAAATVPASATILAGATSVAIPVTGVAAGTATISASSPGITTATATVNVGGAISVSNATVGQYMQGSINVSLATTPTAAITVIVTSGSSSVMLSKSSTAVGSPSVTFSGVTTSFVGTVYVQGQSLGAGMPGSSLITAVASSGYANGTGTVTVDPSGFLINPSQGSITTTTLSPATNITLQPAILSPMTLAYAGTGQLNPGIGPISVPMTSSLPGVGTVTSPVIFNGGDSSDTASFQPVSAGGPITISIVGPTPTGFSTPSQYQSITATVTQPTTTVSSTTIGQFMQGSINVSLQTAPLVPINVVVSSNSSSVLLSKSSTTVGSPSLMFSSVTSSSIGTIYVQGQPLGTPGATASATIKATSTIASNGNPSGFADGMGTVTVDPSGFVINPSQGNITTTTFSTPTTVTLEPVILNPGVLTYAGSGQLNPGISQIDVNITSSLLSVGTISTSPVLFNQDDGSDSTTFQPVASGTTTIALGTTPPTGFSLPTDYQSITATVSAPNSSIGNATIGANMQTSVNVSLATAPPSAVTVTVTSNGPSIATISKSATVVGGTSLTFTNVTSTNVGTIYVQGQTVGTTTVTVAAPGYNSGNGNITVMPSGFAINPSQGAITTTTLSTPTAVTLLPVILNPGVLTYAGSGQLNPGIGPFNVPVTTNPTGIGQMTVNPVVFNPTDSSDTTAFQPVAAGSTTVSIGTPTLAAGGAAPPTAFMVPSQYQSIAATVTAPNITVGNATVGANMQGTINVNLGTAPTVPMNVTVTSSAPGTVLVSKSASSAGTIVLGVNSVTFTSVTSTSVGTVYVQGQTLGSATLTGSAVITSSGVGGTYNNGTGTITVMPSGFVINPSQGNISTTTFSTPITVTLEPVILNPGVLTYAGSGQLNPGIGPFGVAFSSSNTNAGTIITSPVVFNAGDSSDSTMFQPGPSSGTTTLAIGTVTNNGPILPTLFSVPSQYQSITATVTAPNITVGNATVGEYMQGTVNVSLGTAPLVPVNVTITSSSANVMLSTSASVAGTSSAVTFTSVTSTNVGTVYVQGQGNTGTATIKAVATNTSNGNPAGYNSGTGTITVDPSGFVINPSQGNITATPQSNPTTITLEPAILNPGILTYAGTGTLNPNVTFSLLMTSSNTSVGTLSTYTVDFPTGGASSATTIFQPGTSPGTTTLALAINGLHGYSFSTPSQYQSITATLTTPNINISNTTTGVSLETPVNISLSATPLTPVNVTVTSNGTSIATVSNSASTFGQPSVTFTGVTSTSVGTVWVQGQSLGTTTLTVTASGYNKGTGTVTVNPSGFVINPSQGNISTTPTSPATTVTLEPAILTPGILTYAGAAELNPGIGPFNIGITSSNTVAGNITTSPVVFHGGDSSDSTTFQPAAAGTTNLVLGAQPAGFSTPTQYQQITANVVAALTASIGSTTTGIDIETPVNVELGTAPGGPGIAVTVSIANGTGSANISSNSSVAGVAGANVTFNNVTGTNVGTVWVQGLTTGTATLTVTAPGYTMGTNTVTIDPSGFIITSGNISTTTFSPPTTIDVQPAILNPGILTVYTYGQLSPGVGAPQIDVVNTGNIAIGSITTSPVTFTSGPTLETTSFLPSNAGTTTISLGAQPVPFSLPSQQQYTQITATVVAPSSNVNSVTTGVYMEAPTYIELGVAPQGTVGLNVSIANSPSSPGAPVAAISSSPTTVGGANLVLNATTSTVGPIYVQGLNQGTAIITVTPAGEYAPSTGTVTVDPSGFIISSGNITTTPTSSPTTVTVAPAVLTPGLLTFYGYGQLSPTSELNPPNPLYSLTVTSGDGTVGTISTSPVGLNAGDTSDNTTFVPVGAGSTTVTLGTQPTGFSTPSQSQYTQVTATVVAPDGTSIGNATTGVNMQTPVDVVLGSAPTAPINVIVTSLSPGVATVSNSATVAGTVAGGISSVTFNNVTSAFVGTVYIQGQTVGTASLQVTNTGTFNTGTGTATVNPSGFVINSGNILTTLASTPSVMVVPAVLNPGVLTLYSYGQLNPGIGPYGLAVTSTNTGIGTISTSPVSFSGGATSATTTFQPVAAGTTTVNLGAPPASGLSGAFSTPSQYQQVTATVTAPSITVGNVVTGVNMENPLVGITLSVAPSSPITVTVTSNGPSIAVVSNGSTIVGMGTITIPNVSTANVGTISIQGLSLGSTTITVSAPGYTRGIGLATVNPSGFVLQTGDFATTNTSPATTIPIYAAVLDPATLDYVGSAQLNPGLSVSVPFSSSNMNVGTITPSPSVPFNGGAASENATFTPAGAVGTSTLTLGTPTGAAGFSTPSQTSTQQIIATVD